MAKVRLGDMATVVTKGTTPTTIGFQFEDSGINFVKIESISEDGTFLKEKFSHISDECNVQMRRSQLQENDILFSIAGAIGRSAIVTKEILPANTNQALAIIRVPKGKIDYNYLLYALSSSAINQQATQHQQGVAQLNISLKNVSDFLLPIYTEAMQKRIVHNLKKIDKLFSLRKQQLAKLDELVKARFVETFGDMLLNSLGWSEKPLECLADIVSGITKGRKTTETDLQEVPYMAVSNVKNGYIDWTTVKTILATRQEMEQYRLLPGDILMTEGGDPDKVGRGAIIKNPLENSIHQNHIFRVRLDESELLPSFFAEYLQHQKAKRYFLGCAKQTTGIASINMRQLKSLPVLLPPLSLQNEFAAFVERVDKQKQTVQQSLEKLELMKKALMQEYFG